jgi:hypothetical protein
LVSVKRFPGIVKDNEIKCLGTLPSAMQNLESRIGIVSDIEKTTAIIGGIVE